MSAARRFVASCLLGLLPGCSAGVIYTHVTVPLDLDIEETPVQPSEGHSNWKTFDYVVRVDWSSAAIADAARRAGLTHIHYADMELLSVFFGAWQQRTAHVYGTGPQDAAPAP